MFFTIITLDVMKSWFFAPFFLLVACSMEEPAISTETMLGVSRDSMVSLGDAKLLPDMMAYPANDPDGDTGLSLAEALKSLCSGCAFEPFSNPDYSFEATKEDKDNGQIIIHMDYCGPTDGYEIWFYESIQALLDDKIQGGMYSETRKCCYGSSTSRLTNMPRLLVRGRSKEINPKTGKPVFDKIFFFAQTPT